MLRLTSLLAIAVVFLISESSCQRFIYPTFRPPPQRPVIIRTVRDTGKGNEPQWLFQGDNIPKAPTAGEHPFLPSILDDVKLNPDRRYARSLSTPSHRGARGGKTSSGSRDTGPTHPGYNRRNAREAKFVNPAPVPFNPYRPRLPWGPSQPTPPTRPPLYVF